MKSNHKITLSEREITVIRLISEGYSSKEIARKIYLSAKTIYNCRQELLDKTGCPNAAALVKWAIREGIIRLDG